MSPAIYAIRRARLADKIGEGFVALIRGSSDVVRNGDVKFPFRQNSNFFYLTGFDEPGAILILTGGSKPRSILLCAPNDKKKALWDGACVGPKKAKHKLGFDEAYSNAEDRTLGDQLSIYLGKGLQLAQRVDEHIAELRIIKDAGEITLMRKASKISAQAHRDILFFVRPEMHEHEVEAALSYHFRSTGADALHAYPMIVGSGKNALTLHYTKNSAQIKSGDLLLIDAGCEYRGYASDITRTLPISGVFSKAQRTIYEIVLRAQLEAIDVVTPGVPIQYVHDKACEVITEGLLAIGLIKASSLDVALMKELYKPFYPHGTSHWLGMDVHDEGSYHIDLKTKLKLRKLEPGMVLTVEPGIYIRPNHKIPKEYWNIGIRIEDDVLVTKKGREVLTEHAPKYPEEIEALMSSSKGHYW